MRRLIIIGAGGHGKVIADNAVQNGYTDIRFLDDRAEGECMGFPIAGTTAGLKEWDDGATDFVIGIGNNALRKELARKHDVSWATLIHPSAVVGLRARVGRGTVVMAGAVINACATVGEHCIINTRAVVEHDNVIEDFVHLSPCAALGGTVHVGQMTHVGIGAAVRNNIRICPLATVGAGAVVTRDIEESGTYVGVPARRMK